MNLTEIREALRSIITQDIEGSVVIVIDDAKYEITLSEFYDVISRAIAHERLKEIAQECNDDNKLKKLEPPF